MMPAIDDDKRRIQEDERVRSILGPKSDEERNRQRAAREASEQKNVEAREQRKTSSFARLLLLALVVTLLFGVARYLLAAGSY
jgi:hypothetical protein